MELSKTKASFFKSLASKKIREKNRLFLAEGEKCVSELFDAFPLHTLIVEREKLRVSPHLEDIYGSRLFTASRDMLDQVSSLSTSPDIIAVFEMREPAEEMPQLKIDELYLALDGIQDPGNLGTIIRTCDWFGVSKIFASRDTASIYNPKTVQSTMGSLARVEVIYCNLETLIEENREIRVYGTFLDGENVFKTRLTKGGLIVMGNEGNGISSALRNMISNKLFIPPYLNDSHAESLNVGVATAIILANFRNQSHG